MPPKTSTKETWDVFIGVFVIYIMFKNGGKKF